MSERTEPEEVGDDVRAWHEEQHARGNEQQEPHDQPLAVVPLGAREDLIDRNRRG